MNKSCRDKPFVVYCHTNKINNKKYIGITCQELNERFRNGNGYKASPHFYKAIQKYGWDNFTHEIIYSNLSESEAKEKEIELILAYNTRNKDFGYNITPGGEGYSGEDNPWTGRHHTDEAKAKMSKARKGIPKSEEFKEYMRDKLKGRRFLDETKRKMSENHANVKGENNPMYGKRRDPEHMKKMVVASKTPEAIEKMKKNKTWYSGAKNPNSKSVTCIETGRVYSTVKEASEDIGCHPSKISNVLHGYIKHIKGFHFKYTEKQ